MVVAPRHLESSARWVAEAKSNPDIAGIKLHPALGQWDVLSVASFRLIDEVIAPSGLPMLSHTGNDSQFVTIERCLRLAERCPTVRFIAAHLGAGITGYSDASIHALARPAASERLVRHGNPARGGRRWAPTVSASARIHRCTRQRLSFGCSKH